MWDEGQEADGSWTIRTRKQRPPVFVLLWVAGASAFFVWAALHLLATAGNAVSSFSGVFMLLVLLVVLYLVAGLFLNRTTVRIGAAGFSAQTEPLPMPGRAVRRALQDVAAFSTVRVSGQKGVAFWSVHLVTRSGASLPLGLRFSNREDGQTLARRLTEMAASCGGASMAPT